MISSISGRLTKSLLPFLMASAHTTPPRLAGPRGVRSGWDNAGDLGGRGAQISRAGMPSPVMEISKKGRVFARWLGRFINDKTRGLPLAVSGDLPRLSDGTARRAKRQRIKIMVSTLKRAGETAANVTEFGDVEAYPELNPLDKGVFVGAKFRDLSRQCRRRSMNGRRIATRRGGPEARAMATCACVWRMCSSRSSSKLPRPRGRTRHCPAGPKCYFSGQNIERCWQVNFPTTQSSNSTPWKRRGAGQHEHIQWPIHPICRGCPRPRPADRETAREGGPMGWFAA